ncbi:MAG TPA: family 16 glycoside hydrolase [Thermoguttaceae bacterium]|nr:family 16 glycoside hydrolase [Thermoguttaceae bacterium]HUV67067.1 family 16 glycoside hydrolase [Sedimentisphaerales bacterium]
MRISKRVGLGMLAWFVLCAAAWAMESSAAQESILTEDEAGFVPLFNGKALGGWEGNTDRWTAEDGMIIGRSPGIKQYDFLTTTRTFENFVLRFQVQLVDGKGNTGLLYRAKRVPDSDLVSGYQADFAPGKHGNLFDEARRSRILAAPDSEVVARTVKATDWNDYEVRAEGARVTHFINGVKLLEYTEADASIPRQGVIALQIHKGEPMEVRFRNLRIKEIRSEKQPPADLLSQIVRAGDVKPKTNNWGETRQHFQGQTYATEDIFIATVLIHPGKSNHRSHRHAEEEYMVMVAGTGTWTLDGKESPAQRGDVVYAAPWVYHGFVNTGDAPAIYVVLRYKGKGVKPLPQPDDRPNELTRQTLQPSK